MQSSQLLVSRRLGLTHRCGIILLSLIILFWLSVPVGATQALVQVDVKPIQTYLSKKSGPGKGRASVEVVDLTPNFLRFYDAALAENAGPDRRWQLWQQFYGFAAVPPTPEGKTLARSLLDKAWSRYPKHLDRIRKGSLNLRPSPQGILDSIVRLLGAQETDITIKLIVFVGGFEDNAFAFVDNGLPTVAIPIEIGDKDLREAMTHEFTHAVHSRLAGLPGDYVRPVAELVLAEGLAERVTEKLIPGQKPEIYTNAHSPVWLNEANRNAAANLERD